MNRPFDAVDDRFNEIEGRFDNINCRLDDVNRWLDRMHHRVETVEAWENRHFTWSVGIQLSIATMIIAVLFAAVLR